MDKRSRQLKIWKQRPAYAKASKPGELDQVEQVWENAKKGHDFWTENGVEYIDMGDEIGTVSWDKTKSRNKHGEIPRNGQWDMGHISEQQYELKYQQYVRKEISEKEFLDWYQTPSNYEPQSLHYNRSGIGDKL